MLLILRLIECLLRQLILVSDVVDVSLESVDLLDTRLLSLLYFSQSQLCAIELLLQILQLSVGFLGFLGQLGN
jgi:hypothetical protein